MRLIPLIQRLGNASGLPLKGRWTRTCPRNRLIRRAGWESFAWPWGRLRKMKEHAQRWHPGKKRLTPEKKSLAGGGGPALSAWVAGKCNCIAGQGLTEGEERTIPDLSHKAKVGELEAWGQFKVSSPMKIGSQSKDLSNWKGADGVETVQA